MTMSNLSHEISFIWRFHAMFLLFLVGLLWGCLKSLLYSWGMVEMDYHDYMDIELSCDRLGGRITLLVLGWNILFAQLTSSKPELSELFKQWKFSAILSAFMVTPDYFLVDVLGTLYFPEDGAWRIGGAVSWYMAGMWTIPFVLILSLSSRMHHALVQQTRHNSNNNDDGNTYNGENSDTNNKDDDIKEEEEEVSANELLCAMGLAIIIFGLSEYGLHPLNIWHATERVKYNFGHLAIYVLPAEAILGFFVLWTYKKYRNRPLIDQAGASTVVMLIYTGSLAISYLVIEGRISRLHTQESGYVWPKVCAVSP